VAGADAVKRCVLGINPGDVKVEESRRVEEALMCVTRGEEERALPRDARCV
jgi:hypothetical protein